MTRSKKQIAFIGYGQFGKALASLVTHNGLDYDYAEPTKLLTTHADLVFLTVPTQYVRTALEANHEYVDEHSVIINAAKGIEEGSHLMVHQIVASVGKFPHYYSLIGPSFADGIRTQDPAAVSLGYKDPTFLPDIQKAIQTPYFRVEPAKGFRALELASALKNLYAITCGYARGLGFGANTQAQLISIGLREFTLLAKAMRFADYDPIAPGVVGDLFLTCSSDQSRNFQYGLRLAKGSRSGQRQLEKHTVEGYYTSHSINIIAKQHGAVLPLAKLTSQIVNAQTQGAAEFRKFLSQYRAA